MKNLSLTIVVICTALTLGACDNGAKSPRGFSLPEGNVIDGEAVYTKFRCSDCHVIAGKERLRAEIDPTMTLPLGGNTTTIKTYGELVTSVINPSHVISKRYRGLEVSEGGKSKMLNYNYVLTVNELIDLVAFLQAQYELELYDPTIFQPYDLAPTF
jgi:L-cysteine S-thiosulfotransferase